MPYSAANDPNAMAANQSQVGNRERESRTWFKSAPITPSDTVDLTAYTDALIVTGAGTLKILPSQNADATPVTFGALTVGQVIPIQTRRVFATGTSATVSSLDVA